MPVIPGGSGRYISDVATGSAWVVRPDDRGEPGRGHLAVLLGTRGMLYRATGETTALDTQRVQLSAATMAARSA